MNDKHSLQHAFDRFDASDNEGYVPLYLLRAVWCIERREKIGTEEGD